MENASLGRIFFIALGSIFASQKLGSLIVEPREDLSVSISMYYSRIIGINKKILAFGEIFPHQKCPFCPVIFGSKLRNCLIYLEIYLSTSLDPDRGTAEDYPSRLIFLLVLYKLCYII